MTTSLHQTYPTPADMTAAEWDAFTQDPVWQVAVDDAEQQAGCVMVNGFQKRGWMTTWPELSTYTHYMQLRSLMLRGFDAILREADLGVGYQAASDCGKTLVFERFFEPGTETKARLLALVAGENLGPRVELTAERSAVIRAVLQEVLTAEDWEKIAQAAAQQVQ
jgi:hypothetical protein